MPGRKELFLIFLGILLSLPALSIAQSISISGYIKDAKSGETLPGANIYVQATEAGTVSNLEGAFELSIPEGETTRLRVSYIGYSPRYVEVLCWRDTTLQINLLPIQQQLQEIVVEASADNNRFSSGLMNVSYLSPDDIKSAVGFLGEPDVIKVLQLKPGIQSGSEGSNGFFVRGGQADQNLILLDGAPVYNPSHLFGMFSLFSSEAIEGVKLYKGGFPARFGGRIASVMDIDVRPGSKQDFKVNGGTGLISSRLTLEGPLLKNKVSWLISARRTYFDLITSKINEKNAGVAGYQPIPDYFFYDLNGKLHARLGPNDELSFTGYTGNDRFDFSTDKLGFKFLWGNRVGAVSWKHDFNKNFSHKLLATYSSYQYRVRNTYQDFTRTIGSGINDLNLKSSFEYLKGANHTFRFGLQYTHHKFEVLRGEQDNTDESLKFDDGTTDRILAHEAAIYASDSWQITDRWQIDAGLRISAFEVPDYLKAEENKKGGRHFGIEPRFSTRFKASDKLALKASYGRAKQYVHMVSSSGSSLPSNFWYPSNKEIRPQIAEQYAIGSDLLLNGGAYLLSNEIYYRPMQNQIDFRDGAELGSANATADLVFGNGWAYGNEFYIEKKKGSTTGWIGYTISWSERQFDDINGGNAFPSSNDRRHDFTFVLSQEISERLSFNANWIYCTGNVTTLPKARVLLQDQKGTNPNVVPVYSERNSYRLGSYHRLDLGIDYQLRPSWGDASIRLGVYNVYNRRNPYFIYFEQEETEAKHEVSFAAKQLSLFPILPSLSFNYSF